jgi:hypothetical protein
MLSPETLALTTQTVYSPLALALQQTDLLTASNMTGRSDLDVSNA